MRFCVLGSGSKGNATFVEAGGIRLLIDAGLSGAEIRRRLAERGIDIESLSAILLSHEHIDHCRSVALLARRHRLAVHGTAATLAAAAERLQGLSGCQELVPGCALSVGSLTILPFAVCHDAADPVGFVLEERGARLGVCTDSGTVTRLMRHRLAGCHGLVLESNHEPELLRTGPYPPRLKQRVAGQEGHLSNQEAAGLLADLLHDRLSHVVLAHLSEINNRPDHALAAAEQSLAAAPWRPRLAVASQETAGELVELQP
ncbi:MAG: MBL fold metallo-hydrolase [Thermodesulfobacteriota bacterium]